MKVSMLIIMIGFCCVLVVGCQETVNKNQDTHLANSQLINSYYDIAVENAIISQHTLFPYHFVKNGAELNELGRRDFAILTKHFMQHAGHLNVRRGDAPADIYEARVNLAFDELREAGIEVERMSVSDDMPGGSGMPSERVLTILEETDKATPARTSTTY